MKVGKPTSKRVPVRLRHKIQKASNAKQRKQRKDAKKNPQWKSRVKKDPGIPNLFPYKAKVLAEIEEQKRRKEEESARRREIAKAQREGRSVAEVGAVGEEVLMDDEEVDEDGGGEGMEVEDTAGSSNPMAALLASARARAEALEEDGSDSEAEDEDDDAASEEWTGITDVSKSSKTPTAPAAKPGLPKAAIADPIKTCTKLLQQMQHTTDGIQRLIAYYQMPPLVTANSDLPTRFLVEVARKRGRLGRGGVPNLHAAALTVLGDVNDGRVVLPSVEVVQTKAVAGKGAKGKGKGGAEKGEVKVVEKMAEPFRIEGLFGEDAGGGVKVVEEEMVVEK